MDEPLAQALEAVRGFVAGREPLGETLSQIAALAVKALEADSAGVTLLYPDGRPRTAVSTDETAVAVDRAQYAADAGPCLAAYRTRDHVVVDDTGTDTRWPGFTEAAQRHGVRSSLSCPLVVDGDGIGALNLYSAQPRQFSEAASRAGAYALEASVALANAQAYWDQASRAEGLERAMEHRAVIEQAKGVIMATARVAADEAFEILRQQSQVENRKLRDVAAELVARQPRERPEDGQPPSRRPSPPGRSR